MRLNSGQTLFIEPGGRSGDIPGDEINDNPMVEKLLGRHVIALNSTDPIENSPAPTPTPETIPTPDLSPNSLWEEPVQAAKPKKQTKSKSKGGK
jgi:hypothetical protein